MHLKGKSVLVEYDQYIDTPDVGLTNFYQATFPADFDDFELIDASGDLLMHGQQDQVMFKVLVMMEAAQANEEWLISPEIDLSGASDLLFQITQEIDLFGADVSLFDILIATDYNTGGDVATANWTALSFDKTIFGNMTTSEDFDFSDIRWRINSYRT